MDKYKKLNKQPLKFVLAEFRFSPVLEIADLIPQIQKALRKSYPNVVKGQEQAVQVKPGAISLSASDSWAFISTDKKSAIDINQSRLVYMTADYPRFGSFSDSCRAAIRVLADNVELGLILRIGLRYGDAIVVDQGEQITDLINPEFGIPKCMESLGPTLQHSTNTFLKSDMGGLVVRSQWSITNMTCLPDMLGVPISIPMDAMPSERLILDFDHFWEVHDDAVSFEQDLVMEKLSALHETSRDAFWKATSDHARNVKWA